MAQGGKHGDYVTWPQTVLNPDGNFVSRGVNKVYESIEFNLADSSTDYSIKTSAAAFLIVETARNILIRSDSTISFKFNSASNHAITLTSVEEYFKDDSIEITDVFITNNSGGTAAIKLYFTGTAI